MAGVAALFLWANSGTGAAAERPAAVFDVELLDTSGEGTSPDQARRLERVSQELRDLVEASPRFTVVPIASANPRIAGRLPLRSCNGCELDLAREVGAEVAVTTTVHKISTLILSLQIVARDAATGDVVAAGTADIRGDNDTAWLHGVRWLARNRLGLQP